MVHVDNFTIFTSHFLLYQAQLRTVISTSITIELSIDKARLLFKLKFLYQTRLSNCF